MLELQNKENTNTKILIYEPDQKKNINKQKNDIQSKSTLDISKNKPEIKIINENDTNIINIFKKKFPIIPENYEILDKVEKGSDSLVTTITHKKSKIKLTLKYSKNKNKTEEKILSKLKNENIIRFISYISSKEDASEIYIMENGRFGNLRSFMKNFLKRYTLSETMLCYFTNDILKALLYCHMNKVAHMDLKPQNVVLNEYLQAKLIDFSISIDYKGKNLREKIKLPFKGTKPFMPLEIMEQEFIEYKNLNKIDLYELGVMIYYLAFGFFPYEIKMGDDYETIKEKIKNNKLEINNKKYFSKYFIDFLEKILNKNVNERISIFEAVNHYWIKGGKIIYDEKEKTYNIYSFATHLMTDSIKEFNDYLGL